ncbi:hypothetical protein ACFFMP_19520 [Pseudoroseomonas cervicalis]|uniref:DUF485 domain-containing protein n=1 Tax=Pseudoroseomonas cervicalis ATCC 49957 TaxID=525371 RepID=D5RQI5_9PROT|nr:hypothetical protein [Pseudoroseomonas cervicalis]EFH10438.1 hypothetical protein HMPREF0731_3347 [Pseudoroseomonas cervicalis ATCC 49957]
MTAYKDARVSKEETAYSSPSGVSYDEEATSRKLRSAIKLLAIFCVAYFVAAMIATPEFKHIAQIEIMNLPLGFYTGILVFVVGIVVTRMCLNQDQKS